MVMRKGFPEEGEVVIVTVQGITPYSASCALDEYPGKEGMIHVSEVSGKWVRDIKKFVKKGKMYPAKVLRVDKEKGHINLSLKRLSKKNKERKLQEFKNEERAEKILEEIGKKNGWKLKEAYEKIGFDLQDKFGTMFKAFEEGFESTEVLLRRGVDKKTAEMIHEIAKELVQKKKVKIKVELNLKFFSGDGVEKLKVFLADLEKKHNLNIKYVSAPKYSVEILTDNPKLAERELKENLSKSFEGLQDGEFSFKIKGDK